MKRHILKKEITTVLFMVILFAFAIINLIHTWPYLKEMDTPNIDSLEDIQTFVTTTESVVDDNVLGKYTFVEAFGVWNLVLDKNEVDGFSHIKDDNGYLHYSNFWNEENDDVDGLVDKVLELREQAEKNGTEVVILMPPVKDDISDVSYETGMPYSDKNWVADEYLSKLQEAGFKVLDFRETIKEAGLTYEESFYVTDHHWTTEAVFVCFQEFVARMEEWYGIELDPDGMYTDAENYNILKYEDSNLGSHGRDTGIVYAGGLDDFTLMYPKYYTNFTYEWVTLEASSVLNGRFEDTVVSTYNIINSNIYGQDKYSAYMNGVAAYDKITNNENSHGANVLFLRDSCTSPFASFAAQVFNETDLIWTLKLDNNLSDYVNIEDYDYIIISLYPDSLKNDMFKIGVGDSE